MIKESVKIDALARLKRIEGQVRGIQKMIENDRHCFDIILQVEAARKAVYMVSLVIVKNHLETCVKDSLQAGPWGEKIDELIDALCSFAK